jgi:dolichol-phosphate mannosyltransferase
MKLSILIPVYNEEKTIDEVLQKVLSVKLPCQKEIVVVDDGSTDGTIQRINKIGSDLKRVKGLTLIRHKTNLGKGAAIQTGIKHATGDYILIQDADLEYNPSEIPLLLSPILQPTTYNLQPIAVYGSRFSRGKPEIPLLYFLGNRFLTFLTNLLYGTRLTDMETGYKLLPSSFLKQIRLTGKRFEIEPEITIKLLKAKIPIQEVPITYKGRSHVAGKKLTVKDAWAAIRIIITSKWN